MIFGNLLGKRAITLALGGMLLLPGLNAFAAGSASYTATDDDTFWKLSQRFCIPLQQLMQANPAIDPLNIYAGLKLTIPSPIDALQKTKAKLAAHAAGAQDTLAAANAVKPAAADIAFFAKTTAAASETAVAAKKPAAGKLTSTVSSASKKSPKTTADAAAKPSAASKSAAAKKSAASPSTAAKKTAAAAKSVADKTVAAKSVTTTGGDILAYSKVIDMKATAYSAAPEENGWGAVDYFGNPLKLGTVAVDPGVVPLGTKVYVSGYDFDGLPAGGMIATATDAGSAIVGNRVDIFVPGSAEKVSQFGFQQVKLYVLK